ncbi:hypothetical protein [Gloeobacter violaceus]|uniref:Gsr2711 protein n=1 Tax=Gloeobacter violaceus (strain ATCC 29082 / PCC 7421) TaxID=251221 RepID=Q7NH26_GLOVI|nr:hypothetical protein [Gloeobacter violaceus]BAC90652.1 gsr2711 [Gloeobacter violaceus PCC 7421]
MDDRLEAHLLRLCAVGERQAETAERQHQSIEALAAGFIEQGRAVTELAHTARVVVEGVRRAAEASEAAALLTRRNTEALAALMAELRRDRP